MSRWTTNIPISADPFFDDFTHDHGLRMWDQNFGMGFRDDEAMPYYTRLSDRRDENRLRNATSTEAKDSSDKCQFVMDVQHFLPRELSIRTVDRVIIVEAKHGEKRDEHGTIERHFKRKYQLPSECDPDDVTSSISQDGILTIIAPRKPKNPPRSRERTIPITSELYRSRYSVPTNLTCPSNFARESLREKIESYSKPVPKTDDKAKA